MVRRYRFEDISTPNRRLNEPMAVQGPWEAPALEQDCLKGVATRCDSGRRTCFYFHWGLLASIYFHRPWRCQLQLPRMPSSKCHTLRDHKRSAPWRQTQHGYAPATAKPAWQHLSYFGGFIFDASHQNASAYANFSDLSDFLTGPGMPAIGLWLRLCETKA